MSDAAAEQRPPMTIREQAELLHCLMDRTITRTGATAAETMMYLSADQVEDLRALAHRLARMAPYENAIKQLVIRK